MALHYRKSLISKPHNKNPNFSKKFETDGCYSCYFCPDDCILSSPPPPLQLSPPPELSGSSKYQIPTILILMLCVLGVAFLVLSYLTISKYRNSRRRNPRPPGTSTANFVDENQGPVLDHPIWFIRTVGLPQSVIDSIASFAYRKGDGLIDGNDCAVCLNDFQHDEMVRLLPKCSHAFHLDCIDTWLRSHKNCPVCRAPVVRNGPGGDAAESSLSSSESGELESRGETEREDDGSRETRPTIILAAGVSDEVSTMEKLRVVSDLTDRAVRVESFDHELQPVRRLVSMDL